MQEVLQRREDIVQPFDLARIYQASVPNSHTRRAQVLPRSPLTLGSHTRQEMNEPEEGDYGWTTLMDEDTRIEDVLTLWNKDVDNLVVFVRDHHTDHSSSKHV